MAPTALHRFDGESRHVQSEFQSLSKGNLSVLDTVIAGASCASAALAIHLARRYARSGFQAVAAHVRQSPALRRVSRGERL